MRRMLWWSFVIIWIMIIFYFSSQPGEISRDQSLKIVEKVEDVVVVVEHRFELDILARYNVHNIVRKNAHVFNYFVLSIIAVFALDYSGVKGKKKYIYAWLIGTAIAMADEFYQSFIPGRSGEIKDVFIDNIGVLLGLIVYYSFIRIRHFYNENLTNKRTPS